MKFVICAAILIACIYQVSAGSPTSSPPTIQPPSQLPLCVSCKDFIEIEDIIPVVPCDARGQVRFEAIVVRLEPIFQVVYSGYCVGYYQVNSDVDFLPRGDDEAIVYKKVVP